MLKKERKFQNIKISVFINWEYFFCVLYVHLYFFVIFPDPHHVIMRNIIC